MVAYYGGLRTNELRAIEFGKVFSGGEHAFEVDSNGYWFSFERSKQRGATEVTTICVPRRQEDWIPVVGDSYRAPVDYDPASIIDEYLEVLESDLKLSREELSGPFFRSTHGVGGLTFLKAPLGINYLGKIGVEFAMQLGLADAAGFTGHCWRRSCGTNASNAGVNVTTLMAQLGWSTPKTALGYVKRSKITSLTMSMFLSNIQRQNKVLDAGGVRSTPKGFQLLKSETAPRSTKKKLNPEMASGDALIDDPASGRILSEIEREELYLQACEDSSTSGEQTVENSSSSVALVSDSSHSNSSTLGVISPATISSSASVPDSIEVRVGDNSSSDGSGSDLQILDPSVSAILQNFQNNGNVQIHFHFTGKN